MCRTGETAVVGETAIYSREGRSTEASYYDECTPCAARTSREAAAATAQGTYTVTAERSERTVSFTTTPSINRRTSRSVSPATFSFDEPSAATHTSPCAA
jgi:hypothetical protein